MKKKFMARQYPNDDATIERMVQENRSLWDENGVLDYAKEGKSAVEKSMALWKKATSTKIGMALSIIVLIVIVFTMIFFIMGFGVLLSDGNPIGIVKVVLIVGVIVGTLFLLRV
jgi:hypothetical protein